MLYVPLLTLVLPYHSTHVLLLILTVDFKRHVISTHIVVMGIISLQTGVKLTFARSGSLALELEG